MCVEREVGGGGVGGEEGGGEGGGGVVQKLEEQEEEIRGSATVCLSVCLSTSARAARSRGTDAAHT